LLQTLIAAELVDEYRIWVFPLVLGEGKRLFENGVPPRGLSFFWLQRGARQGACSSAPTGLPVPFQMCEERIPTDARLGTAVLFFCDHLAHRLMRPAFRW
jgi:RibD C-terminal domain